MKDRDVEKEANIFAVCLLIPKDLLIQEIDKMQGLDLGSDKDMEILCKKFGVTQTAMMFRMSLMNPPLFHYQARKLIPKLKSPTP